MCVTLIFRYTPLQLVHWMCFKCWNWIMFFFLHTEIEIQTKLHIGNEIRSKLSKTLSNLRLVSPSNPPPPLNPTKTSGYASDLFPLLLSLPTMGRYCLPSCLLKVKMIVHAEEFLSLQLSGRKWKQKVCSNRSTLNKPALALPILKFNVFLLFHFLVLFNLSKTPTLSIYRSYFINKKLFII